MTAPMTPERLAEIRERNNAYGVGLKTTRGSDVSELLAEVGRLRAQVAKQGRVIAGVRRLMHCNSLYGSVSCDDLDDVFNAALASGDEVQL